MDVKINIRKATENDADAIWEIAHEVVKTGDTWAIAPDTSKIKMLEYFFDKKNILTLLR